ncbi:MAG TPA: response regulator [Terriglobales bacterium]|jgi:ActR/RegA family two-component response regulator
MPEQKRQTRLLFVDDEPAIRLTMPMILSRSGFDVTVAASVKEAIQAITTREFDVLLTDLDIGEKGDGFTVVSAMRRTQPKVVTVILTGFPAFDTALRAIRSQVDEYLVKPADPGHLVQTLRQKLSHRTEIRPIKTERMSQIIEDHKEQIVDCWLTAVLEDPDLGALPIDREQRAGLLPYVIDEIVRYREGLKDLTPDTIAAAMRHGRERRKQGYTVELMIREARLLHRCVCQFVQDNLLSVDISYLVPDMISAGETIEHLLEIAVRAFFPPTESGT